MLYSILWSTSEHALRIVMFFEFKVDLLSSKIEFQRMLRDTVVLMLSYHITRITCLVSTLCQYKSIVSLYMGTSIPIIIAQKKWKDTHLQDDESGILQTMLS